MWAKNNKAASVSLVWFRRDLRVADHEALRGACTASGALLPFYAFDNSVLGSNVETQQPPKWFPDMGPYRARFMLESLHALDHSMHEQGTRLHFSLGSPSGMVAALVQELSSSFRSMRLHYHLDYGAHAEEEAAAVDAAFADAANEAGVDFVIQRHWDRTLVHPSDLPQRWAEEKDDALDLSLEGVAKRLAGAPSIMTDYRKAVEADCPIRASVAAPRSLPSPPDMLRPAPLPATVEDLYEAAGLTSALGRIAEVTGAVLSNLDAGLSLLPRGGEKEAWKRLRHFLGSSKNEHAEDGDVSSLSRPSAPLAGYKDRRMMATGLDNSAKLSAHLNFGCITPRQIHAALQCLKGPPEVLDGRKWLRMHLQIRDFFQYSFLRREPCNGLPRWEGERPEELREVNEQDIFSRWCQGHTGFPFVDASMRELGATGYMSNRSRQNVASLLTKGFGIDWRWGEALFHCLLTDYDAASNECNWAYIAGQGSDPRGGARVFRTVSQGMKYDDQAQLLRTWLPELRHLPIETMHRPWLHPDSRLDYPPPILRPASQLRREDR